MGEARRRFFGALASICSTLALTAPSALAEEPAAAASAPATARDVVKLKNGGLLRGTISELIPNEFVVIVTVTGETRRLPMSEVEYAGPDQAPSAEQTPPKEAPASEAVPPRPAPAATQPPVPIVRMTGENVSFFVRAAGKEGYSQLCKAPCDVSLLPGYYSFSLAPADSKHHVEAGGLTLTGPATIEGRYRSRAQLRGTGGGIGLAAAVIGGALWYAADENDAFMLWTGRFLTVSGVILGLVFVSIPDAASVQLLPPTTSAVEPRLASGPVHAARNRARRSPGFALSGAF